MNNLLEMLSGGNLQSDGRANEVAEQVVRNPNLFSKLAEGLWEPKDLVRARTAHAIERISRAHPEMVLSLLPKFIELSVRDAVPMVKWHIAMIFGNLTVSDEQQDEILAALFQMLKDTSVFVKSWSIVSLTILGHKDTSKRRKIINKLKYLQNDKRISIRSKAIKALTVLRDVNEPIPAGWVKAGGAGRE